MRVSRSEQVYSGQGKSPSKSWVHPTKIEKNIPVPGMRAKGLDRVFTLLQTGISTRGCFWMASFMVRAPLFIPMATGMKDPGRMISVAAVVRFFIQTATSMKVTT